MSVIAAFEPLTLPTYPLGAAEKNPMFFEKRVYQGSNGKVYPIPFVDKVFDEPSPVTYRSVRLENEHVRLVLLPELGGRILVGQDKGNADYDFFYRQTVIKPALVGLAGPWISGGVEFNWPQHHRPGTFLPADVFIEEEPDGARTVWMSEHDPLNRLKGMHGFRLRPDSALIEVRVRLHNRTAMTQTFLWWTNVAARVHAEYQSFFPPDVHYVADHAMRGQSSFPVARNPYYGVNYRERPGANDLTWYRNIPVPTSYMVCETEHAFFGGYDHRRCGGFVHVANRFIAPGKKQWTWGDHAFGHAWDRELTDEGGPYIELMAGVYTDNQPDFSYLAPGETKTFSQFFWPIGALGPVHACTEDAALHVQVDAEGGLDVAVGVSAPQRGLMVVVTAGGGVVRSEAFDLKPSQVHRLPPTRWEAGELNIVEVRLESSLGEVLVEYQTQEQNTARRRTVATEPPAKELATADELRLAGEHLEQYRHPTRNPETYWRELLRRDPGDAGANLALGRRRLREGRWTEAVDYLEKSVARLTSRNPNPSSGEAHYHLGLAHLWLRHPERAYALFYKATWNFAWRAAAYYELALLDAREERWAKAFTHLELSLDTNRQNNRALVLKAAVLRKQGCGDEAAFVLADLLRKDPLDHWARWEQALASSDFSLALGLCRNDAQTVLDVAFDYIEAGFFAEAVRVIETHHRSPRVPAPVPNPQQGSAMTSYVLAYLYSRDGADEGKMRKQLALARAQAPDYFFPSRLWEMRVLAWAIQQPGDDGLARFGLGNLLYDRRRHAEAVVRWEEAVLQGASFATVFRNLGLAYWNLRRDGDAARRSYQKALELDPRDARLVSEYDQLCKKLNDPAQTRLAFLEQQRALVEERDDTSVELASLLTFLDRPQEALELLQGRRFHPWEGGEGAVLRQYMLACLRLGQRALAEGEAARALAYFEQTLTPPANLGEAYHLLQAKAQVYYWQARALERLGRREEAQRAFEACAGEQGDFAEMAVVAHSPLTYFRGLALRALGREAEAVRLFEALKAFAERGLSQPAEIDYFATSLPNLLVFEEDLKARKDAEMHLLLAQACAGLADPAQARIHLETTRAFCRVDPWAEALAQDLEQTTL